jgi:ABC-type protease/lipase transport system fused ATPase/permease subunit
VRHMKASGRTVMVASHKPVLATLADRIKLLDDGVIEVFENRDTVLTALRRQSLRPVSDRPAETAAEGGRA